MKIDLLFSLFKENIYSVGDNIYLRKLKFNSVLL